MDPLRLYFSAVVLFACVISLSQEFGKTLPTDGKNTPILQHQDNVFQELPLKHPVSEMALTEDGTFFIALSETAGRVMIWNICEGRIEKTLKVNSPSSVICRGQKTYIASKESGSVLVVDVEKWDLEDEILVGQEGVVYITAPSGTFFKQKLIATCWDTKERVETFRLVDLEKDTNSKIREWRDKAFVSYSYDGSSIALFRSGKKGVNIFEAGSFETGKEYAYVKELGYHQQLRPGAVWFGSNSIMEENYCSSILHTPNRQWIFGNAVRDVYYELFEDKVKVKNLFLPPEHEETISVKVPKETLRPTKTKRTVLVNHLATTIGKNSFLFFHSPLEKVFTCRIKEGTNSPTPKPLQKDDTVAFASLPLDAHPTAMAYSEDGRFLIIASRFSHEILIWDVAGQTIRKRIPFNSPSHVLSRGTDLFVSSFAHGNLTVIDMANWKVKKTLDSKMPSIYYLSAPIGSKFQGKLLGSSPGTTWIHCSMFDINNDRSTITNRTGSSSRDRRFWESGCDGKDILQKSSRGKVHLVSWSDFRAPYYLKGPKAAMMVKQFHSEGFWYGNDQIYGGKPIQVVRREEGKWLLPDTKRKYFFAISPNTVELRGATLDFPLLKSWKLKTSAGLSWDISRQKDTRFNPRKLAFNNFSITNKNEAHLFLYMPTALTLYSMRLKVPSVKSLPKRVVKSVPFDVLNTTHVRIMHGSNGTMLIQADKHLHSIDKSGKKVLHSFELSTEYKKIQERPDYYLALKNNSIQFFDKKNFREVKKYPLPTQKTFDMAIHPKEPLVFISLEKAESTELTGLARHQIVALNENTGEIYSEPEAFGHKLVISSSGKYLFSLLHEGTSIGYNYQANVGCAASSRHLDMLRSYEVFSDGLRLLNKNTAPGVNGRSVHLSPDGKLVAYIGSGGYHTVGQPTLEGNTIAAFDTQAVHKPVAAYFTESEPVALAFHPQLDLVAAAALNSVSILKASTGQHLPFHLSLPKELKTIRDMTFTPDGEYVVIFYEGKNSSNVIDSIPLTLTDEQKAQLSRTKPDETISALVSRKGAPSREIPLATFSTVSRGVLFDNAQLHGSAVKNSIELYQKSLVLVQKGNKSPETGVFVSSKGHVLCTGNAIPLYNGDNYITYDYKGTKIKTRATLIAVCAPRNLALFKCNPIEPVMSIRPFRKTGVSNGDEVLLLGHTGKAPTVFNGVISQARREIKSFLHHQLDTQLNPGMIGALTISRKGALIGIGSHNLGIDKTSLIVPADDISTFISRIQEQEVAND